jgi:hypothetical protein
VQDREVNCPVGLSRVVDRHITVASSVPRGVSTNSAEDRGHREGGSGGSSPLVRGFTQFVIDRNPYSD